jgi:hypothetical protein
MPYLLCGDGGPGKLFISSVTNLNNREQAKSMTVFPRVKVQQAESSRIYTPHLTQRANLPFLGHYALI